MDDLTSVQWTAPKAAPPGQQYPQASGNYYPALRPTPPLSGRSTPALLQPSQKVPNNAPTRSNASTPANDSFANLVTFNAPPSTKGLSLQEQQRRIQEEKAREEAQKAKAFDAHFGTTKFLSDSSNGRISPNRTISPPTYSATSEYGGQKLSKIINKPFAAIPTISPTLPTDAPVQEDNDLLAAFNASAPVDRSSHMPDISRSTSEARSSPGIIRSSYSPLQATNGISQSDAEDLDDDIFGLGTTVKKAPLANGSATIGPTTEDDDVLGLLGRPVSEFAQQSESKSDEAEQAKGVEVHPQERAAAELVEMGFSPEKSRLALEATDSGIDVQAAVGWLLNQAHTESRKQTRQDSLEDGAGGSIRASQSRRAPGRRKSSSSNAAKPAWMREQKGSSTSQGRAESKSPVNREKDPAQYATELGNKMFKTAGSLWKTGTKRLNQAVQDFNSDSDSSQPKWMRDSQVESEIQKSKPLYRERDDSGLDGLGKKSQRRPIPQPAEASVTDEAMMLEADSRPPPRKSRTKPESLQDGSLQPSKKNVPVSSTPRNQVSPQPNFMQQAPIRDVKTKLSRQAVEEETSQAYISPARRKRTTPKPIPVDPEPDLLVQSSSTASSSLPSRLTPSLRQHQAPSRPKQPTVPKREVPQISSFALQASTKGRQEGNSAFKRGDYAQATTHYSTSLSAVPSTHPIAIVLLTNRALSHSKTGDPKASMADAKSALDLIGSLRGVGEVIDLGDEGSKQMSAYWEKAMMRQAEALEHLERWSDAAAIWRSCVEAGVGGATSSAGRIRCEKAAAPPSQPKKAVAKARPKASALGDFAPDSESVTRLRAANAAADRLDDEKFALADVVDQRVSKWRAGKEGNLRALLSTLENVLWEGSGWKKVGMGDVLLPGKVKIVYMKGIAKVHPDKLPTTATTEQKMISAAIFATLNDAWEKFKAENNL